MRLKPVQPLMQPTLPRTQNEATSALLFGAGRAGSRDPTGGRAAPGLLLAVPPARPGLTRPRRLDSPSGLRRRAGTRPFAGRSSGRATTCRRLRFRAGTGTGAERTTAAHWRSSRLPCPCSSRSWEAGSRAASKPRQWPQRCPPPLLPGALARPPEGAFVVGERLRWRPAGPPRQRRADASLTRTSRRRGPAATACLPSTRRDATRGPSPRGPAPGRPLVAAHRRGQRPRRRRAQPAGTHRRLAEPPPPPAAAQRRWEQAPPRAHPLGRPRQHPHRQPGAGSLRPRPAPPRGRSWLPLRQLCRPPA